MSYKNIKFSASILSADWLNLGKQLKELTENQIDFIHFDITDGNYISDFTLGSQIINSIKQVSNLKNHYHLMVEEPMRFYNNFNLNKNDVFTIHQETSKNLHKNLIEIKKNCKVSVALAPSTPIEHLEYILDEIDNVLILTVNPGYMSKKMLPQIIKKIEKLKYLIEDNSLDISITVDGNVSRETIPDFIQAGADTLVLGSSGLFVDSKSISSCMDEIKKSIDKVKS
jgi:ribulose-phosphate 3-epimerase